MFNIGWHLSASEGFFGMGKTAFENGASTFAFFTRNPRGGKAKDINEAIKIVPSGISDLYKVSVNSSLVNKFY